MATTPASRGRYTAGDCVYRVCAHRQCSVHLCTSGSVNMQRNNEVAPILGAQVHLLLWHLKCTDKARRMVPNVPGSIKACTHQIRGARILQVAARRSSKQIRRLDADRDRCPIGRGGIRGTHTWIVLPLSEIQRSAKLYRRIPEPFLLATLRARFCPHNTSFSDAGGVPTYSGEAGSSPRRRAANPPYELRRGLNQRSGRHMQ